MVAEAAPAPAAAPGVPLAVVEGRAEDLAAEVGSFGLVTIGRALHWKWIGAVQLAALPPALSRQAAASCTLRIAGEATRGARPTSASCRGLVQAPRSTAHGEPRACGVDGTRCNRVAEIIVDHSHETMAVEALVSMWSLTRS